MKDINFHQPHKKTAHLIMGIVATLSVSGVMVGLMLSQGSGRAITATIGNTLEDSPTSSISVPKGSQIPQPLTDTAISSSALGPGGNTVRYSEAPTGRVFDVDPQTHRITVLSEQKTSNIIESIWSPDGQGVAVLSGNPTGTTLTYSQYLTGTHVTLGSPILAAAFSPNSQRLAYLQSDTDHATLSTSAVDGSDVRLVMRTRAIHTQIGWPQTGLIALTSTDEQKRSDLVLVGLDGSLTSLLTNLANLEYTWSPNGFKLLYSYFQTGTGIQLGYLDLAVGRQISLGVSTSARKCAWHSDESAVTCGVPSNSTLSRDVPAAHSASIDDIITINLATGEQHQEYTARSGTNLGVINPVITTTNSFFVFTNLFDQRLYGLSF